jgi:mxaD protein
VNTLKVEKTVDIDAPVDEVWDAIKDFDSLHIWHPAFASDEIIKGENNKPHAVRKLTVKDGPSFTEELLEFDPANHTYSYRIIESPLPVRDYVSRITVTASAKGGGSRVLWSGTFKRKSTSDTPPENENDAAATNLITGVYESGLANLRKIVQGS